MEFGGAKLAILHGGEVLTLLRDDRPDIPYPNHWDLPGGGREGRETPEDCVLRETSEEMSITLHPSDLIWAHAYPAAAPGAPPNWFFVSKPSPSALRGIRLGDEGQAWRWAPIAEFLSNPTAVPRLKIRLDDYLRATANPG
ncbi:MAG: NUDIX hydrolase [Pseudomonadota bacterium]